MAIASPAPIAGPPSRSAAEIARALGPELARRAKLDKDEDAYVFDNIALLKEAGLVEVGVPRELGGSGAEIGDLAAMLRILAYQCGSTGLAFSMHTHQVAIPAWRWRHQKIAAVEPLLQRVARERIMLLSSGGSDWIGGSGKAEKVEGGYRITARKVFTSGAPTGDILMTGAVLESEDGPIVLHFGIPMNSPQVKVLDTWRTLGMRGTGSHDVLIDGHVVPEAGVAVRRKAGEWHAIFQIISTIAFPLIYSVYLGVAEAARDIAIGLARRKPASRHAVELAGRSTGGGAGGAAYRPRLQRRNGRMAGQRQPAAGCGGGGRSGHPRRRSVNCARHARPADHQGANHSPERFAAADPAPIGPHRSARAHP